MSGDLQVLFLGHLSKLLFFKNDHGTSSVGKKLIGYILVLISQHQIAYFAKQWYFWQNRQFVRYKSSPNV